MSVVLSVSMIHTLCMIYTNSGTTMKLNLQLVVSSIMGSFLCSYDLCESSPFPWHQGAVVPSAVAPPCAAAAAPRPRLLRALRRRRGGRCGAGRRSAQQRWRRGCAGGNLDVAKVVGSMVRVDG